MNGLAVQDIITFGALVVSCASAIGAYVAYHRNDGERLAKLEVKVDTLWDFQLRRAAIEATNKGLATMNSPVELSSEIEKWCEPFRQELRDWYATQPRMSDRDLAIEIERVFGDRLLREVCIPHKLDQGACLLIAAAYAKAETKVELPSEVRHV